MQGMVSDPPALKDQGEKRSLAQDVGTRSGFSSGTGSEADDNEGAQDVGHQLRASKKQRTTLSRGAACIGCRSRKSRISNRVLEIKLIIRKCSGEKPCSVCMKMDTECLYQVIQKKKPKAILLEERLAELEALLADYTKTSHQSRLSAGASVTNGTGPTLIDAPHAAYSPGIQLSYQHSHIDTQSARASLSPTDIHAVRTLTSPHGHMAAFYAEHRRADGSLDVPPNSALERALITVVLPYTPFIALPIHPQRLLALLDLPPDHPNRPHPALMYILFAGAADVLERRPPLPYQQPNPFPSPPHHAAPQMPPPPSLTEMGQLALQVAGMTVPFLERATIELDNGMRNVDRPFDLYRASIGIAQRLYTIGRFVEGWNVPVTRLLVSCGLHRMEGFYINPDGPRPLKPQYGPSPDCAPVQMLPPLFETHHTYPKAPRQLIRPDGQSMPSSRQKVLVCPLPRDEIDLAERMMGFWAGKQQDWLGGLGWGWTTSLADEECTTQWPWGNGVPEPKPNGAPNEAWGLREFYDPESPAHQCPFPDSTFLLAVKSIAIVDSASRLFDLPYALTSNNSKTGTVLSDAITRIETTISSLRRRIHPFFRYEPRSAHSLPVKDTISGYDCLNDVWWFTCHLHLLVAEMFLYHQKARYVSESYIAAVTRAEWFVDLVVRVPSHIWPIIDLGVIIDISFVCQFFYKEGIRLHSLPDQPAASRAAFERAEVLRLLLAGELSRWTPMAALYALIVERVRDGLSEKEGEYERL